MRILIAPNSFKNAVNALDASGAIRAGLQQSRLKCSCECFPIGDGGDGTGDLIIRRFNGSVVEQDVHDPLKRKIRSSFGLIDHGDTAVIEMAKASGISLLSPDELNPLESSAYGTGEMILHALDAGVKKIIITMGGSATIDGGAGILRALGIRFLDHDQSEIPDKPEMLTKLSFIDTTNIDKRIFDCELVILCDVENKLLGMNGAASVFGHQKGASPEDISKLEHSLVNFSKIAFKQTGTDLSAIKHGGTAGGAAAGLHLFLKAKLTDGINYFLDLTGFDNALQNSELVITGEGSIDEQTLQGKGPFGVAQRAKSKGIPVIGIAGKVPLRQDKELNQYFDVLLSIGHQPSELSAAMRDTLKNLERTSTAIGNLLAVCRGQ